MQIGANGRQSAIVMDIVAQDAEKRSVSVASSNINFVSRYHSS